MGVPVLNSVDRQSNRIGESFAVALGESEWVVEFNRQLIELVQKLGQDIEGAELRRELRGRVEGRHCVMWRLAMRSSSWYCSPGPSPA